MCGSRANNVQVLILYVTWLEHSSFSVGLSSIRCKARSGQRGSNEEFGMFRMKTTSKTIFSLVAAGLLLYVSGAQVLAQSSSPSPKTLSPKALKKLCAKTPSDSRCPASSSSPSSSGSMPSSSGTSAPSDSMPSSSGTSAPSGSMPSSSGTSAPSSDSTTSPSTGGSTPMSPPSGGTTKP
jgi:hypothetical protein